MNNLIEIQAQIDKLQKQASDLRSKDFQKTVREIKEKMQAFGITVKDLQNPKAAKGTKVKDATKVRVSSPKKVSGATVAPKYRGPDGQTWSGRGLTPRWMTSLLEQGRTKYDFLIQP